MERSSQPAATVSTERNKTTSKRQPESVERLLLGRSGCFCCEGDPCCDGNSVLIVLKHA